MFAMIDTSADFYNNINMVYMTLTMLAPMALLMLATMGHMYQRRALNAVLYVGLISIFIVSLIFIRGQRYVGDEQFLRSMIPHHSGAILMCRKAGIVDRQIKDLCDRIIVAQRAEIDQMKTMLQRVHGTAR
ncbi:DUF305 domain-containing protein [Hoeflea sp. 108]|jgi:hypothetical protein|uniref:DUF305 domain-containing protein n=1 Tax=Hoeflea sp. 108 TaxID=1116369 RepID=UPI0003A32FC6|nr:DUF305 domain-containing protein [Hoeflea sp. 108]